MIVFSGVEIPSNRKLLEAANAKSVMLNFYGLRKRGLPKNKTYLLAEHFDPEVEIWVMAASPTQTNSLSVRELEEFLADYQDFIANNYDRINHWIEFDNQQLGLSRIVHERGMTAEDDKMWVVWHEHYGIPTLNSWAEIYKNIAIPHDTIESVTSLAAVTRGLQRQHNTRFHALSSAKPDNLRRIPFHSASTLSWLSPMRRGETIVWDGQKLVRYPKKMKEQARPRYKKIVEDAGLDYTAFKDDDTKEATKVAVWSLQQLGNSMSKDDEKPDLRVIKGEMPEIDEMVSRIKPSNLPDEDLLSDNSDDTLYTGLMEFDPTPSNNSDVEMRKKEGKKITPRDPSEKTPMPVFGYKEKQIVTEDDEGNEVLSTAPVVESNQSSLRQCNTCFVAASCPAFKEDSTCAFNLPVEVKTKDQLKSLLQSIIEMQGQRVAFMRFAEELNGGYADPNVSQEVDRLFKLVKNMKELEENREFVRITAERQSSGGVLSAIFGDRAQALQEMQQPLSEEETTEIIRKNIED